MKIAFKNGDGIVITNDGNLPEKYLVWTDELQLKYDSFVKAVISEDYTDIIEGATEKEIKEHYKSLVPTTIPMMKLRMQLIIMGTSMEAILDTIIKLPTEVLPEIQKKLIMVKLEYTTHLERYSPELVSLGRIMFTDEQLDYIFVEGNKL